MFVCVFVSLSMRDREIYDVQNAKIFLKRIEYQIFSILLINVILIKNSNEHPKTAQKNNSEVSRFPFRRFETSMTPKCELENFPHSF